ncbi:BTAD domain-containing putative transcriptional regulator [Nonomuraea sp. SYSU D8015]|uniref:BTAD domain-containing putative transcriptional regulator n=1 Tax=Nonomuraea sp. SYSU D8015 TaxID=2593644 RepID=UPI001660B110|nr:BTAD domain-containing putative transcriptional regulator [Nonomuraea sp. SYSU D8015]
MRFGVLGPLAVWTAGGEPVRVLEVKVRALLADLLIHAGRPVSADRLVEDLWADRPPADALAALRVKVSQLRRVLGDRELVAYQAPGYVLRVEPESVDGGRFEALLGRARRTGDPSVRASLLQEALELWRGGAYVEFADEPFAQAAVARLDEQRMVAVESLAEARVELGEHALVAADLADLVARHPLRERLRAVHVRALYLAGRQGEALAAYEDLRRRLADELGLDPGPELAALHQAILRQDPALDAPARPRTNLPAPLTPLVGRESALAEVRALLRAHRLVTLTGPGGVGKTRLALAAAATPDAPAAGSGALNTGTGAPGAGNGGAGRFGGGVWLVEMAALRPGAGIVEVAEAVAGVLGLRDDLADSMVDRLTAALDGEETLLVLDNCEHVVEQVAAVAARLLRAAPRLRVLATSQESLRIEGEALWSVPPLASEAAVELFAARAGIEPDATVAEICARLDGLPLALELAATRVRALGVRELADRLDDRFRVLGAGLRDAPARQRTLRAMIDWSWELLGEAERVVLRRLAVHADGCTLQAAEEVCAEPGVDVLDTLARLVDRSLVVRTAGAAVPRADGSGADGFRSSAAPRYRLLESVAAYCQERLREAGEHDLIGSRHLRYYTALAERAEPYLRRREQRRTLAQLDTEGANLRTALETAVRLGAAEEAVRLVNAMAWYWVLRGRLGEGRRALEAALSIATEPVRGAAEAETWLSGLRMLAGQLSVPDPAVFEAIEDPLARARARWFIGFAMFGYDDLSASADLARSALEGFEALGDTWGTAAALNVLAKYAAMRGDLETLRRYGEQGMALFSEVGDRWGEMRAAENLGTLAEITGDYERAAALRTEVLRMAEQLGLWSSVCDALSRLGRIAMLNGDHAAADDYHERARRLAVAQSNRPAEEFAELGLALTARRQGRLEEAERLLRKWLDWVMDVAGEPGAALILAELGFAAEQRGDAAAALELHLRGLAAARKIGDPRAVALALEGLAGARALADRPEDAALLLGQASALRASVGAPLPPAERGDVNRITTGVEAALGRDGVATAMARGTTLPLDDLLAAYA